MRRTMQTQINWSLAAIEPLQLIKETYMHASALKSASAMALALAAALALGGCSKKIDDTRVPMGSATSPSSSSPSSGLNAALADQPCATGRSGLLHQSLQLPA